MHPIVNITVDGKPVSDAFNSRLISVSVSDKEGTRSDTVSLKLNDGAPFAEVPRRGAIIAVSMGYAEGGVQSLGEFTVDEVELECLPYAISVQGKAADMRETLKERKNRHWDGKTVKDIVTEIAGDHGLTASVGDEVGAHTYEWFGQFDENDMNVVDRLATRHGALFTIKQGRLIFAEKGAGRSSSGQTVGNFTIGPEIIIEGTCKVQISDRGSYGKVVGYYQDKSKVERTHVEVANEVSDSPAVYRLREAYGSVEEAEKAVKAKSDQLGRAGLNTSVDVIGDASIRAGGVFTYAGVRPGVDGIPFIIETAEHSYAKGDGYKTKISGKVQTGESEKSGKSSATTNGTERAKQEAADAAAGGNGATGTGGGNWPIMRPGDGPE